MKTETLSVSEVAFLLRARLGKIRAWSSFLADNIKGRQGLHGYRLMPCCKQQDESGGRSRPRYAVRDVLSFIAGVLTVSPNIDGKQPIKPVTLDINERRPWYANKFDREGKPLC
jgi:hypothetical protein